MSSKRYSHVSWVDFHRDTKVLAESLRFKESPSYEGIIAVTRGGLVPSSIVAHELGIRLIDTICVSSYDNAESQSKVQILKSPDGATKENGKGLIVLDDLVDSGRTLQVIREMLPKAYFAAVYAKPAGQSAVDAFGASVSQDTWIVFPWE
ncbi:MAG: xanthine phosphoribosyltransferase [Caedimonas sp.]|jgi:xanthine phosphoribosyltransferase|nr:xanthine phosphoribosyltransferase [Caedimonas sp.]